MRAPLLTFLLFACAIGNSQQVVTIAGMPPSHRSDVDGKNALDASLTYVYGILRDHVTGRFLFHDETLVERLEPDGTLLAFAGISRPPDGSSADGTPTANLAFGILRGMAQDASGALYLADAGLNRVFRITADGTVTTIAGGLPYASGNFDGQPAKTVPVISPRGLAFDSKGNLLIADVGCQCIRRIDPNGILTTFYSLPRVQPVSYLEGLAVDAADNVYATAYSGNFILKITPDGNATIIAGTGIAGYSGDGGPANVAQLNFPSGIAVSADGTLYIADTRNNRIRRIAPDGTITTIAGTGVAGFFGDGGPATAARLSAPAQILLDPDGTLYFTDYANGRVRRITPDGMIGTIAGNGNFPQPYNSLGDGGPAIDGRLSYPSATVLDSAGNLYVADISSNRVRKIAPDGTISTLAGNGSLPYGTGDGGPATQASLYAPFGLGVDLQNNIYIAGGDSRVRKVDPNGIISLVAGVGTGSGLVRYQGDGGPAVNATLNEPKGVTADAAGNIYIADTTNARLRMIDRGGIIHLVAAADTSLLGQEYWNAVAIDSQGRIYVARTRATAPSYWSVVSRVNLDGSLTTIAGTGQACPTDPILDWTYDGQPATKVPLCLVVGLTFDAAGNLYLPDSRYGGLLRMTPDGALTRVAGNNSASSLGDGGSAMAANISTPMVSIDAAGNFFFAQYATTRIREITKTPVILKPSADHLDLQGTQTQTLGVATNFAEPFTYTVQVKTSDGGAWLSTNRPSGQTPEPLKVSANPAGLVAGTYHGTITLTILLPVPQSMDLPVSLTVK
jgi:sugar lactone lactonase YvrE